MDYASLSDEMLVSLTLTGDQQAYCALVRRYERSVIASAMMITHNTYSTEDAAQDAFVAAWLKLDKLNEPKKYRKWVCRIAVNCAKNMVLRLREYASLDDPESGLLLVSQQSVIDDVVSSSEAESLRESIDRLPEKIAKVIHLHYFEGLSVAEIAAKMMTPVGTVKYQLHEGRKKLRKDLIAMNENINDDLVTRVRKKLDELSEMRFLHYSREVIKKYDKLYRSVLAELEAFPESAEKSDMLAEAYMYGFWWLETDKSDERLAEIKKLALESHNEEVMQSVVFQEMYRLHGSDLIEFTLNTEIPFLEKHGFRLALSYAHFWVGENFFELGKPDEGFRHLNKVLEISKPSDVYYAHALSAMRIEKDIIARGVKRRNSRHGWGAYAEEYIRRNGEWRFRSQPGYNTGTSPLLCDDAIYHRALLCDGKFTIKNGRVGDSVISEGGDMKLTFVSDSETVETPCGVFENCAVYECGKIFGMDEPCLISRTYFKDGTGIVKLEEYSNISAHSDNYLRVYTLTDRKINGGSGLMPFCKGNRWTYTVENELCKVNGEMTYEVVHADENKVTLSHCSELFRDHCDMTDFKDIAASLRTEYCESDENGNEYLRDVSEYLAAMKKAAKTPYEKKYAEVASRVMERIMGGDGKLCPDRKYMGIWDFFRYYKLTESGGAVTPGNIQPYNFEWKEWDNVGPCDWILLFNFGIEILSAAMDGKIWDERWLTEREGEFDIDSYNFKMHTKYALTDIGENKGHYVGEVKTPAGTFRNCVRLTFDMRGYFASYFNGRKEYYFAEGIGLVSMVHVNDDGSICIIYDLAEYDGTGKGYFPLAEGMRRKYVPAAIDSDYTAYLETFIERRDDGKLVMLSDQCGIREIAGEDK